MMMQGEREMFQRPRGGCTVPRSTTNRETARVTTPLGLRSGDPRHAGGFAVELNVEGLEEEVRLEGGSGGFVPEVVDLLRIVLEVEQLAVLLVAVDGDLVALVDVGA